MKTIQDLEKVLVEAYDALAREKDVDTAMACLHESHKLVAQLYLKFASGFNSQYELHLADDEDKKNASGE